MKKYECHIAQSGFFAGPVYKIKNVSLENSICESKPEEEFVKYKNAKTVIYKLIQDKESSTSKDIDEIIISILDDELFINKVENHIFENKFSAVDAIKKTADELAEELGGVESEYIAARKDDIRGVAAQLIAVIEGKTEKLDVHSAVFAEEISPAQLAAFDESLIGALVTDKGSPNSHASIIAGNLSIPYLYGCIDAINEAEGAEFVIIDGESGTVTINPDDDEKKSAVEKMKLVTEKKKEEAEREKGEAASADTRTKVYANIAGPEDIDALIQSGADGVGLFRTEFLFLASESEPGEEEQYQAYVSVLKAMGDKEVIIRTMDIGSDKKVSWLSLAREFNPALGMRGARVSLEHPKLFKTQLRALLRAGVNGNLKVMFPMIAAEWEIDEIKKLIDEAAAELKAEGIAYRVPSIGIMIETPAAAVMAEVFARKVDFFSIGTNDLTQYTLALDRESQGLNRYFNPYHEAVFKLIEMTAEGGHKHGALTGVCGQLAADPNAIKRLIKAGVNELSVPVSKVRSTKLLASKAEAELEEEIERLSAIGAVADGEYIPMYEIPDAAFASGSLGKCFGILPENGKIYAPVDGTVISIAETGHAVIISADNGMQIMIHAGIDTVKLGKEVFKHFVSEGSRVSTNQLLMEADLDVIRDAGYSTMIITVDLDEG